MPTFGALLSWVSFYSVRDHEKKAEAWQTQKRTRMSVMLKKLY